MTRDESIAERSPTMKTGRLTLGRFLVVLGILFFAAFPNLFLGRESFGYRDFGYYSLPLTFHLRESLLGGEIPLWNPLNACGIPFLAQWSTLVLYPLSIFLIIFPLAWAQSMFGLLHLLLGGLGAYLLARNWTKSDWPAAVAGVAFSFNGLALSFLLCTHVTVAYGWLPWVVLCVDLALKRGGRWICAASLVGTMQMLGGVPEYTIQTWLIAILLTWFAGDGHPVEWARRAGRLLLVIGFIAALSAAQLLPFFELLSFSQRSEQVRQGALWAMPPSGWANLFVPLFNCVRTNAGVYYQTGQELFSSYYSGIVVLALAVTASLRLREKRVRALILLALLGFLFSLGGESAPFAWLQRTFPLLEFMRYPIRNILLSVFALSLLAGYGAKAVLCDEEKSFRLLLGIGVGFALVTTGILIFSHYQPAPPEIRRVILINGLVRLLFLAAGLYLLFRLRNEHSSFRFPLLCIFLLVLLWFDIKTHVPNQNPTLPPFVYEPGLVREYQPSPMPAWGEGRIMIRREARAHLYSLNPSVTFTENYLQRRLGGLGNVNLLDAIAKVDGFFSLYPSDHMMVMTEVCYAFFEPPVTVADFLGVCRITEPQTLHTWSVRTNHMPLVYSGQQPEFVSDSEITARLCDPDLDLRKTVLLFDEARTHLAAGDHVAAKIEMIQSRAHLIEFTTDSEGPAMVTIAQTYYPHWRATVSGKPVALLKANGAFQALEVPAGQHHVRLKYVDRTFHLGLAISSLALLLMGWFWLRAEPLYG